jgi:peroxiredoxin
LAARLVLAAVFVVSGLGKLADRPGSRQAMIDFGVPQFLAAPAGFLLPLAELATAILLIPLATAWWGGIASLVLLLLFVAGIGVNLARGRTPDCHCFGQIHSEPIGWPTLARNGVLALIAAFIVVTGSSDAGTSAVGWLGNRSGMEVVGLVFGVIVALLIVAEAWFLLHLMQQNGRLLTRLEALEAIVANGLPAGSALPSAPTGPVAGLPVGSKAPAFSLSGLHGETMTLDALRAVGKPTMLIFSDPGCGPCNSLLPEIGKWQREDAAKLNVALVSRGTVEANRAKSAEHGLTQVLLQNDREVAESYLSHGTPGAVVVRPDGTIDSPLAQGAEQIRNLVARTVGRQPTIPVAAANGNRNGNAPRPTPPPSRVGQDAPAVKLPDLDGKDFSLEQFRGKDTLLLFWNPGCGFCQRMLKDLKEWEEKAPSGSPKLLIVSTGTAEANKAMGLRSTTVLDQGFTTGRAFGASGTPSAILVDARGKIASEVGVGAQAVLALAAGPADAGKRA